MLRKKAPVGNRPFLQNARRRTLVVITLVFALLVASGLGARRRHVNQPEPPVSHIEPAGGSVVSPMSLDPNSPLKEYVYIGGKLVATEEPAP